MLFKSFAGIAYLLLTFAVIFEKSSATASLGIRKRTVEDADKIVSRDSGVIRNRALQAPKDALRRSSSSSDDHPTHPPTPHPTHPTPTHSPTRCPPTRPPSTCHCHCHNHCGCHECPCHQCGSDDSEDYLVINVTGSGAFWNFTNQDGEELFNVDVLQGVNDVSACFSSHSVADVKGKGEIRMSEIQVGDQVMTGKGTYETIYSIDHRHPSKVASFLQIFHGEHEPLELTDKHMLFLEGNTNPVPAFTVKIGDQLQTPVGPSEVKKISTVSRYGVFNPLTNDGTIVVNGAVASTYSAAFSEDEWITVAGYRVMTHQSFYNNALKPYRFLCNQVSLDLCKTNKEKVAISQIAADTFEHWEHQEGTYKTTLLIFFVSSVFLLNIASTPQWLIFAAVLSLTRWFIARRSKLESKKVL